MNGPAFLASLILLAAFLTLLAALSGPRDG